MHPMLQKWLLWRRILAVDLVLPDLFDTNEPLRPHSRRVKGYQLW